MQFLLMTCVVAFAFCYFTIEKIGFFSNSPLLSLEIIYSVPMLSASIILFIVAIISLLKNHKKSGSREWIKFLSVLLIVSGFWLSYLTRFSGEVVLTEGQTFYSGHNDYIPETVYRGRFSTIPDIALKLDKVIPSFSSDGQKLTSLKASFEVAGKESKDADEFIITDGLPRLIDGSLLRIKKLGYSPRYALKSKEGKVLDSSFMYMKLFPPGSEDNFRLLSPLTYYVRYYPYGHDGGTEPLIGLRIVRNKDIVFDDKIKLVEDAVFENSRISFDEVRHWSILTITHDRGVMLYIPGFILAVLYAALLIYKGKKVS
jgi:hypothetical protein